MSYQLYDNGASIKFVSPNGELLLMKIGIEKISVIRGNLIKISKDNCLGDIFIKHQSVSVPVTVSAIALVNLLNSWIVESPSDSPSD